MSTMIALLLVLSALAGCAGETLTNVKNAVPPPEEPPAALFYTVEIEEFEQHFQDARGQELAVCTYTLPALRAVDGEGRELPEDQLSEDQQALIQRFCQPFDSWKANAEVFAGHAEEDRETFGVEAVYSDDLQCSVYQTDKLISVSGAYYTYTGGAHPNTILLSWNFDLETGEYFDPGLLDEETGFQEAVRTELVRQAEERAREAGQPDFFWSDYPDTLANWSSYAVSFGPEGMTVGFSPYELACYAAGPQVFQIPYDLLEPHLSGHGRALLGLE